MFLYFSRFELSSDRYILKPSNQLSASVPGHCSAQYTYQIQMSNQSGAVFEREFTSEFEAGECWGYNRFFQLDRLNQYVEHDQLRFIFYVR